MRKVNLSEEAYNKLKSKLINEISYGTVSNAYDRSDDLFWELRTSFEDFQNALADAIYKDREDGRSEQNPYLVKIKELSEPIYDILVKKRDQQDKFFDATTDGVDHDAFFKSPDADENELEDMDLNYLQKNYPKSSRRR